jgi:hypothetical protein
VVPVLSDPVNPGHSLLLYRWIQSRLEQEDMIGAHQSQPCMMPL